MTDRCPSDPSVTLDADGFCPEHGNDCDDFALSLSDQASLEEADDTSPEKRLPTADPDRAIAFLADSRASTLLLAETVDMLVADHKVHHALVELHSPAGLAIADALLRNQVDYSVLAFGQDLPTGASDDDPVTELLASATQVVQIEPSSFAQLRAQLCVVPAMIGSDEVHIDALYGDTGLDMAPSTLPGLVVDQAQIAERSIMMIDAPERGLVRQADGAYRRRVMHIGVQEASR